MARLAESRIFDNRYKFPIHIFQIVLIVGILILSVVKLVDRPKNAPRGRSGTMGLGMSAKSLVIILYQILSEHVQALKKWSSLKAYVILNALEVVFWGAVVFMTMRSNMAFCEGITCIFSWIIVGLGILMSNLASYMTVVTWLDFRHFRKYSTHRGRHYQVKNLEVQSLDNITICNDAFERGHKLQDSQERLTVPQPIHPDDTYRVPLPDRRGGGI